jgi:hypothetical protein
MRAHLGIKSNLDDKVLGMRDARPTAVDASAVPSIRSKCSTTGRYDEQPGSPGEWQTGGCATREVPILQASRPNGPCEHSAAVTYYKPKEELFVDPCSRLLRTDTGSLRALPYRLS